MLRGGIVHSLGGLDSVGLWMETLYEHSSTTFPTR
jgi:hypothetical protein